MLGLLSADTWTLVAIYIRNLILNWLLFAPFFAGCLLFPHWCFAVLRWAREHHSFDPHLWIKAGGLLLTAGLACAIVDPASVAEVCRRISARCEVNGNGSPFCLTGGWGAE
jgi:hypothetical protein